MSSPLDFTLTLVSSSSVSALACRNCGAELRHVVTDLGVSPLCESYLSAAQLRQAETFYPLCAYVCEACWLVQVQDFAPPEAIFSEYAYFSSFSDSWVEHARSYAERVVERFNLRRDDAFIVEIASNDGYLLKHFVARGVAVLGVDPAQNIAEVANRAGVPTLSAFFGAELAERLAAEGKSADLMAANNVLAHVPDINDFVLGFKRLLKPEGVITFEFPHLLRLLRERQFDTIYHEHFSYLSVLAVEAILTRHGLKLFDVETLSTHGGSLRIYAAHADSGHAETANVAAVRAQEKDAGLDRLATYLSFDEEVQHVKHSLLRLLLELKRQGKTVAGYGAPGKGNTLLNYCGVRSDLLSYTVDRNPYKQGKFLPGTHIPIFAPDMLAETKPDYILMLPWNLKDEIAAQLDYTRAWGARFIVPIPQARVW